MTALVTCWWTYTVTGGLETPFAIAVTRATPVPLGVHTTGAATESHTPPQARPLFETVSTLGSLD